MTIAKQKFNTFRELLESFGDPKKKGTFEAPTLVIPEHGAVLTSTLPLEQCFIYLTDKTLQSTGEFHQEDDIYIIFLEGIDISPFLITSHKRAISREIEERCYQMRLDRAIVDGAHYYLCYFRQREEPWGNPTIEVSFVHPQSFSGNEGEQAQKRAKELEQERYNKNDMNVQVEARLARSLEDAKAGIFLDS